MNRSSNQASGHELIAKNPHDPATLHTRLSALTAMSIYPASINADARGSVYFLARKGLQKFVGMIGPGEIVGHNLGSLDDRSVTLGPTDHRNARALRAALPWTAPRLLGLKTSIGLGDRLGLAAPGHVQAVSRSSLSCVLAQQSIREMTRTRRSPDEVIDCATWGVLQEGFRRGFGADADHLQTTHDIDVTAAAGFTMYTIDPGRHVNDNAALMDHAQLRQAYEALDFKALAISPANLQRLYCGKVFALDGGSHLDIDDECFYRAAVKYAGAVAHVERMYHHLLGRASGAFEIEVSLDETESPTSVAEHYFVAAELRRLGVPWVSLAPRFVGRFEKGVDYIGSIDTFRRSMVGHAAVMRTLGPYKISLHSGSDKFSIYPVVAELAGGLVHLKTAGTSYLEALRAIAAANPQLFREILEFARGRYDTDKATYHVSATLPAALFGNDIADHHLPALLDDFNIRQILHVTFGSVLTEKAGNADNAANTGEPAQTFRHRLMESLQSQEELYYKVLNKHITRHLHPFTT